MFSSPKPPPVPKPPLPPPGFGGTASTMNLANFARLSRTAGFAGTIKTRTGTGVGAAGMRRPAPRTTGQSLIRGPVVRRPISFGPSGTNPQ